MPLSRPRFVALSAATALLVSLLIITPSAVSAQDPPAPIAIPAEGTSGPAGPYPSTRTVTAPEGEVVLDVNLHLAGLSHTWASDVAIMLVAPDGVTNTVVVSGAGQGVSVADIDLVIDDEATADFDPSDLTAGSYRPTDISGAQLPAPAPARAAAVSLANFDGIDPGGDWSLYAFDAYDGDAGSLTDWNLEIVTGDPADVPPPTTEPPGPEMPPGAIAIPGEGTAGPAAPYPATSAVAAPDGEVVLDVNVRLDGFTHTWPSDVKMVVVAPDGSTNELIYAGGGGTAVDGVDLVIDDEASTEIPVPLTSGSYRPPLANVSLPSPAPGPTPGNGLSTFDGVDPDGEWSLYIHDRAEGDGGWLVGWSLEVTTGDPSEVPVRPAIVVDGDGRATPDPATVEVTAPAGEVVTDIDVRVDGFSHGIPERVAMTLYAPDGTTNSVLMYRVGGQESVSGVDLVFDDEASGELGTDTLVSGTFSPTWAGSSRHPILDQPSSTVRLANFDGIDPNGTWSLRVSAGSPGGATGEIGNWSLDITTGDPSEVPPPPAVVGGAGGHVSPYPSTRAVTAPAGEVVTDVDVRLDGLHGFGNRSRILLVAPDGTTNSTLLDRVGGQNSHGLDLVIDDQAESYLDGALVDGTFRPTRSPWGITPLDPPAPAPARPVSLGNFNGIDPNGEWSLYIEGIDATGSLVDWSLDVTTGDPSEATPPPMPDGSILIPADGVSGWADPNPSTQAVSAPDGELVSDVNVRLEGFSHSCVADVDVYLRAPDGTNTVLFSDVGGCRRAVDVDMTIDDEAADPFTQAAFTSGAYRPTNVQVIESRGSGFEGFADLQLRAALDNFDGVDPNGRWELLVFDDDGNTASDGWLEDWSIEITTAPPGEIVYRRGLNVPAGYRGGPADRYPSERQVSAPDGAVVTDVDVRIDGLTHGWCLDELDLMLVGPGGDRNTTVLSDAGDAGCHHADDLDLVIDDEAGGLDPGRAIVSGSYAPIDEDPENPDHFPAPAPRPSGTVALSNFDGADPSGTWQLYAVDDLATQLFGVGEIDDWDVVVTYLAPPTDVSGVATSGISARVSFLPGEGDTATGYEVRCESTDGGATRMARGAESPIEVTGLTPNATYRCQGVASTDLVSTGYGALGEPFIAHPTRQDPQAPGWTHPGPTPG